MLKLRDRVRDYEKKARPLSDLLPWVCLVAPSIAILKDGSLMMCMAYDGCDMEGKEDEEINNLADLIERSVIDLDSRISILSTIRRSRTLEYPDGRFKSAISEHIDVEWRKHIESKHLLTNQYWMSITYSPPEGMERLVSKIWHSITANAKEEGISLLDAIKTPFSQHKNVTFILSQIERHIKDFQDIVENFSGYLTDLRLRVLQEGELRGFLRSLCSPASFEAEQTIPLHGYPGYLDSWLSSDELKVDYINGRYYLIFKGREIKYCVACSVKGWPNPNKPGMLDGLLEMPCELTLSQLFRMTDRHEAESFIKSIERFNNNLKFPVGNLLFSAVSNQKPKKENETRKRDAADAREALMDAANSNRRHGYHNYTILVYGNSPEECDENAKRVINTVQRDGYIAVREHMHLLSAWAGTLPGNVNQPLRMFFVTNENMANIFPVRTFTQGEKINKYYTEQRGKLYPALTVFPTEFNTPYYFNCHHGDLGHVLVMGPSRSGKSVLVNFLIAQFRRYEEGNVFILDKDYSCRIPTVLQDGVHIDPLSEDRPVKLNPCKMLGNPEHVAWFKDWVEILITYRDGAILSADDSKTLWDVIQNLRSLNPDKWRLKALHSMLPKHLQIKLEPWIEGGQYPLFDNDEDSFSFGGFTCIENGALLNSLNKTLPIAFAEYAFKRLEMMLDGTPTLIYVEEFWFLMANEFYCGRFRDWLKTLGKRNAFMLMSTQSLDDIEKSSIFSTIVDNVPTRVFLPNSQAYVHRDMYRDKFGLNDKQIDRIARATPKRQYYIVSTGTGISRLVESVFPKSVIPCLRSDKKAQELFLKHSRSGAVDWKKRYVEEASYE